MLVHGRHGSDHARRRVESFVERCARPSHGLDGWINLAEPLVATIAVANPRGEPESKRTN